MPIVEPAPWRHQYFDSVACPPDLYIPTDDPEAWEWNPAHRWVFDKLQVALSQGLAAGPHGTMPPRFPVFSKPIMNFRGLGGGSRQRIALSGEPRSPIDPAPDICPLFGRCSRAAERCKTAMPPLREIAPDRRVACHYPITDAAAPEASSRAVAAVG